MWACVCVCAWCCSLYSSLLFQLIHYVCILLKNVFDEQTNKKTKDQTYFTPHLCYACSGVYIGTTWRIWLNDHRAAMKQLVWNYFDHSLFIVFSSIPVGRQIGNRFCVDKRHVAGYRSRLIKIPSAGEKQRMHTCKKRDCGTLREWSGVGGTYVCGAAAV